MAGGSLEHLLCHGGTTAFKEKGEIFPSCLAWKRLGPLLHPWPWGLRGCNLLQADCGQRERRASPHFSLEDLNITCCFYFLQSMESIQVWRAGSLAELILSGFQLLSSPVEEY